MRQKMKTTTERKEQREWESERERGRKNILKDNGTKQTCSHKEPFTQEICHTTRTPLRNKDLFGKRHLYSLYTRNTHNQDILHKDPVAHCFCLPSSAMGSPHWGGYGSKFKTLETKDAGHLSHVRVSIAVFRDPIMLDMRNRTCHGGNLPVEDVQPIASGMLMFSKLHRFCAAEPSNTTMIRWSLADWWIIPILIGWYPHLPSDYLT